MDLKLSCSSVKPKIKLGMFLNSSELFSFGIVMLTEASVYTSGEYIVGWRWLVGR
jgi:hypothetical protein